MDRYSAGYIRRKWFSRKANSQAGREQFMAVVVEDCREEQTVAFLELAKAFGAREQEVDLITCPESNSIATGGEIQCFRSSDISWNGSVTNPEILKCLESSYDILIAFTGSNSELTHPRQSR